MFTNKYFKILTYTEKNDNIPMVFQSFIETFQIVLTSYILSLTMGFIIGLFLYKNKNSNNKIKKILYSSIKKMIDICTNMPFIILSLFINAYFFEFIFSNNPDYIDNKGSFACCCFALTVFVTLIYSKKIENFFIMQEKKGVKKIKDIIHNKESLADLVIQKTSLLIICFCYSTIAASSYGGTKGKSISIIAYKYGFNLRQNDNFFQETNCNFKDLILVYFICVILVIQLIKLVGFLIEKKIRNKK